jgi:Glutathione S-transferase, C-terminal domain
VIVREEDFEALQLESCAESAPGPGFSGREGRENPDRRSRSRQARAQDASVLRDQSVSGDPGARTRQWGHHQRIDICRYIEELHPEPNLFGLTPLERATIEMWQRRVEWHLLMPIAQVFRHTHPKMAEMEQPQVPDWAMANRPRVARAMSIFDQTLKDRPFVAGERFTVADITGLVSLDFTSKARIAIPPELVNLGRWHAALQQRPSAAA